MGKSVAKHKLPFKLLSALEREMNRAAAIFSNSLRQRCGKLLSALEREGSRGAAISLQPAASAAGNFSLPLNAMGAAERRFLYNPLRQLRDEEPLLLSAASPGGRDAAARDSMGQSRFPRLTHLARRAFSQACLAYFPGTPCPEANASGCKQIAHPALPLSQRNFLMS